MLGLGNLILSDDGLGIKVARLVAARAADPSVSVIETSLAGLDILESLAGFGKVIIIDAIQTRQGIPGQIRRLCPAAKASSRHCAGAHDVDLFSALAIGERLGFELPREVVIYAIEALDVLTLGECCTPEVEKAIPTCAELVLEELAAGAVSGSSPRRREPAVLIVDDEAIVREAICDWLNGAGCRAVPAFSAEEALLTLAKDDFDLLVTDYKLPGIDGLTLLKKVKAQRPALKTVIITAYPSRELEIAAGLLHSVFLTKPVEPVELEKLVQEAVAA